MFNPIKIIVFIALLFTIYLTFISNNINEKILLLLSSFFQILFLYNTSYLNNQVITNLISKMYGIVLVLGIYYFTNISVIFIVNLIILTTLTTQFMYDKCLLINEKINYIPKVLYFSLLIIYLHKFIYV